MQRKYEHAFNKIIRDISEDKIGTQVLLYGDEKFLIDWAKKQLIESYTMEAVRAFDVTVIDGSAFEFSELMDSCETLPMFSEKKIVILENYAKLWRGFDSKNPEDKKILEYLEVIPDTALLIITAEKPGGDQKKRKENELEKLCKKEGNSYFFEPLSITDLRKFAVKRFQEGGKKISSRAMNLLLENSGYSNKNIDYALYNFENDIKKIIALSPGEEITENAVLEGISDNLEYNVFKMLDSICTNRKDIAFMLLNDMLLSGGNEYGILSAIIGQLEVLLQVKELRDMGIMPKDISKKIKVHEFRVKNAYTFVTNFSERDLRRILISAFETDYRIKSGLLAAPLALEMLIADIYRAKAKVA